MRHASSLRHRPPLSLTSLVAGAWLACFAPFATSQTTAAPPPAVPPSPGAAPAYEVTTVKPVGPNEFAMPLRVYIQSAFGLPSNSTGWVLGPGWIDSARYVIQGKPPDATRDAMRSMTAEQRGKELKLMMQGLLADRFKLKAHFETRQMPVFQLTVAKGGPKFKENPDRSKGQAAVARSGIRGVAVPIHVLCDLLNSASDLGGRVVIDETGLAGTYDIALKWTPLEAPAPPAGTTAALSPEADSGSLFAAIQEQLGLKLVPAREPSQILVIDHIERPSEN